MLIEFAIWGEYDELTKNPVNGRPPETVGVLRVKLHNVIVHEEECHRYTSPNDRESAIIDVVKRVIVNKIG